MKLGHNSRHPFQASRTAEVDAVFERIRHRTTFAYRDLADLLGPCNSSSYPLIAALRRLAKEGIHFANDPGVGYRRLDDEGKSKRGRHGLAKAGRQVRRTIRVVDTVDEGKLSRQSRPAYWATRALLTTTAKMLHGNSINAATRRAEKQSLVNEEKKRLNAALKAAD